MMVMRGCCVLFFRCEQVAHPHKNGVQPSKLQRQSQVSEEKAGTVSFLFFVSFWRLPLCLCCLPGMCLRLFVCFSFVLLSFIFLVCVCTPLVYKYLLTFCLSFCRFVLASSCPLVFCLLCLFHLFLFDVCFGMFWHVFFFCLFWTFRCYLFWLWPLRCFFCPFVLRSPLSCYFCLSAVLYVLCTAVL